MPDFPKVFLDVTVGNKPLGRLVFELFTDLTPVTAENFRGLCTGDYGTGISGTRLSFMDTLFHKILPKQYCAAGDIVRNNGTSGESVYGPTFPDEDFTRRLSCAGLLATVNKAPNTNSSQFIITFGSAQHLDGKSVVFGQLIEGMPVLRKLEQIPTLANDRPKYPVAIFNCGELDDDRDHIKFDEFREHINVYKGYAEKKAQIKDEHLRRFMTLLNKEQETPQELSPPETTPLEVQEPTDRVSLVLARLKQARKANEEALAEDVERRNPAYNKRQKKKEWLEEQSQYTADLEAQGLDLEKKYLQEPMVRNIGQEKRKRARGKRNAFGWDVFNQDALLRGYKRRLNKLEVDKAEYEEQKEGKEFTPKPEALDRMAAELEEEEERRKQFSHRRPFYEDLDVNFINERNRVYNAKLTRHFQQYSADMRANIERGTAL
jgi:cyclophilin family peptidyl-prolyl cis-trans isomerase